MKKWLSILTVATILAGCICPNEDASSVIAVSPDGRNALRVWLKPLSYEVLRDDVLVVSRTRIGLHVDGMSLENDERPVVSKRNFVGTIPTPIYKKDYVNEAGCETYLDFGAWGLRLVARDDGVAYRFETRISGDIKVTGEDAGLTIPDDFASCSFCYGSSFGCEEAVPISCLAKDISNVRGSGSEYVYLPMAFEVGKKWCAVLESDVCDYPVWNLRRDTGDKGVLFVSVFAKWPVDFKNNSGVRKCAGAATERCWRVNGTADYLVETEGTRTFPWRSFLLADTPSAFCAADIVYALARPRVKYDFSWVRPGKVAWDWWNDWDNKGEERGCNTAMYKRYIDFASKNGIEYVILDEGWSERLNIWKFHPNVNVPAIIDYARGKGVGIVLWMAWAQVYGNEAKVASYFSALGAKGFKIDFIDRGDADSERFIWKFADECAKNQMIVDYHGTHRPTGISRAYPNVLNFEGVHGLESMKFYKGEDFADIDVKHFFLRMSAGAMDYTPGAMDNYPLGRYAGSWRNPGSLGTRCRQMALMVLYEAPLQMLCDSPSKYEANSECLEFMRKIPVVWSDTKGLGGDPCSFAAVARKSRDGVWYAAGITNKDARDILIDSSFLGEGKWIAESFCDAGDADVNPTHYVHNTGKSVDAGDKLSWRMSPGGGCIVRFERIQQN